MESWDHAVKVPNGYVSNIVFGWNKDLCEDWAKYQMIKILKSFIQLNYSQLLTIRQIILKRQK